MRLRSIKYLALFASLLPLSGGVFGCASKPSVLGIWSSTPTAGGTGTSRTYVFSPDGRATLVEITHDGIHTTRYGMYNFKDDRLTLLFPAKAAEPAIDGHYQVEREGRTLVLKNGTSAQISLSKQ